MKMAKDIFNSSGDPRRAVRYKGFQELDFCVLANAVSFKGYTCDGYNKDVPPINLKGGGDHGMLGGIAKSFFETHGHVYSGHERDIYDGEKQYIVDLLFEDLAVEIGDTLVDKVLAYLKQYSRVAIVPFNQDKYGNGFTFFLYTLEDKEKLNNIILKCRYYGQICGIEKIRTMDEYEIKNIRLNNISDMELGLIIF